MTLAEIVQNSVAPVIVVAVFLWFMDRSEKQRATNAKALGDERKNHELTVFNLFASSMKQMVSEITKSNEKIIETVNNHEDSSQERYERNKNTQEIKEAIEALKKELQAKNAEK